MKKFPRFMQATSAVLSLAILSGCATVGPDYAAPAMKVPASWQAAVPHDGSTESLLQWWQGFNDPVLTDLLRAAEADNPTLQEAAAAIESARAARVESGAAGAPGVNAKAGSTRSGSLKSDGAPAATATAGGLDASWEIDLFGRVRRSNEAADARLQASQAGWHDARVSLAAEVASEYVNYRACQQLVETNRANLASLKKTATTTKVAADNGLIAPADESLASASAASASAALTNQQAECDLGIKSLVALTGLEEPQLRSQLAKADAPLPDPDKLDVTTLPVQMLSQRPDLVAAERSLAAASARIGVAEANRYPRLSLLGAISIGNLVSPWSFGPSLALPALDGGRGKAQVAGAQADYDAALAQYRGAVRNAVKEVEQGLVRLDAANRRSVDLASSARDYQRYLQSAQTNWKAGGINLLDLEQARRNALQAEQGAIGARRDRVLQGIALYKALGGGWQGS